MKIPYRKFNGKQIDDETHRIGMSRLSEKHTEWVDRLMSGTDLCYRVRQHNHQGPPCIYVFRNEELAEENRGVVLNIDPTGQVKSDLGVTFRLFEKEIPIPLDKWNSLKRPEANDDRRRLFIVNSESDLQEARTLIKECIFCFDRVYGE